MTAAQQYRCSFSQPPALVHGERRNGMPPQPCAVVVALACARVAHSVGRVHRTGKADSNGRRPFKFRAVWPGKYTVTAQHGDDALCWGYDANHRVTTDPATRVKTVRLWLDMTARMHGCGCGAH